MRDLVGKIYGRLTVLEKTNKRQHREAIYLCECSCGNKIEARSGLLSQGRKKSCGCLYKETRPETNEILRSGKTIVDGVDMGMFGNRKNKNNTTGFKGVSRHHNGYRGHITVRGKRYYGVTRETIEEAYNDRLNLENELLPNKKGQQDADQL